MDNEKEKGKIGEDGAFNIENIAPLFLVRKRDEAGEAEKSDDSYPAKRGSPKGGPREAE